MLSFEHYFLNRFNPFISTVRSVGFECIVSFWGSKLESVLVDRIAARNVLKGDVAFGEVWICGGFEPAQNIVSENDPELGVELCSGGFLIQWTGSDYRVLNVSYSLTTQIVNSPLLPACGHKNRCVEQSGTCIL